MNSHWKLFLYRFIGPCLIILSVLLGSTTRNLHAQGFGSITGTVTDASGASIPTATVTATQSATGRSTVVISGSDGAYVFPSLAPAGYSVSVTAPGFQTSTRTDITLQADQAQTLNFKLDVGSTSQSVTVSSDAPTVDTTTGTLSQVIGERQVNDLPLNGRNAAQLTTLVAGVVIAPSDGADQGTTKTFPTAVTITANGSHVDQTSYLLNGGNNLDELTNVNAPFPFPDALQEFSVQTSNYNAEYGQNAGAVVNIVTKSGGERFHGSAFEYFRNGFFNARPYFASIVDPLHRNQFGGTIGGPVIIPHLSTGKSTQFFFGYQKTISHDVVGGNSATVPTDANRAGDFSALCTAGFNSSGLCNNASQQITDPFHLTANMPTPFAFNKIPTNQLDPAAVAFEQDLPHSTTNGVVSFSKPTNQNYNEYYGRVDHNFGSHDNLFGHYYYDNFNQAGVYDPTNLLNYASFANIRYQSALLSDTHTFTTNLLNNLIVNYQREISTRGGVSNSPSIADFGVNIYQPAQKVINGIAPSGYFSVAASAFADFARNNYTFNDDLHWVKGNHNLAFGGHFELSKFDLTGLGNLPGTFTFSATNTGNALASFQMGYINLFTQGKDQHLSDRGHFPGFYAQDSWKATRRLTLNYGLRYEFFSPWKDIHHQQTVFDPAAYAAGRVSSVYTNLPPGLLVAGDSGVPPNGVYDQYKQIMPRVGFALDVFGDGKTALRGGGGIFYQDRLQAFFNLNQSSLTPFAVAVTLTNPAGPLSNPYLGRTDPFPFSYPLPSNYAFPSPVQVVEYDPSGNFQVPVTYDYNLTVEQQLASNMSLRIAYVGSHSDHEFVNLELNPAVYLPGSTLSTDQRRRFNTSPVVGPCTVAAGCKSAFTTMTEASMSGVGSYNSLQATLQKKLSNGLSFMLNYTWSKALDNIPLATVSNASDLNPGESYVYPVTFPNYKALDHGPSDFDHRHVFSGSYVYLLPKLGGGNRSVRAVVNGWRMSGIVQARSGDVITAVAGSDRSLTGLNQDRAQLTGAPLYSSQSGSGACAAGKACKNWLNPAAFALPAIGSFGNVNKASLVGPHYVDWDAGIIRTFPVYRESSLDFRVEYFNLLNHTNLSDPSTSLANLSTFGTITASNTPRIAQFSLKLLF